MQFYQKRQEGFEFSLVLQSAAFVLGHANDGGPTFLTCHSRTARQSLKEKLLKCVQTHICVGLERWSSANKPLLIPITAATVQEADR